MTLDHYSREYNSDILWLFIVLHIFQVEVFFAIPLIIELLLFFLNLVIYVNDIILPHYIIKYELCR